ncbi:hypothetical protein ZWY2020_037891, partial [Hordeum vulgare]
SRKKVRIGLRRNARFGLGNSARRITKWVIHVQASFKNTIIRVTYPQGQVVLCSRKASPYAGQRTKVDDIRTLGLQSAEVMVKGAGSGRDAALRVIAKSGVRERRRRGYYSNVRDGFFIEETLVRCTMTKLK